MSGPTARARVTQIFQNPTSGWVEAVYVYPLPEGGAVDTLKMVIGDRIVIGDIKEKQEAKQIYEQAKAAGHKAALIEQERPNIFTNSVANIGPGETVLVQIEYQEPVRQSGDTFSLRIPLVVGPRYNPKPVIQSVDFGLPPPGRAAHGHPPPQAGAGFARIAPPVLDPREHAPVNPVAIAVRLQAGFPLGEVKSHHHAVTIDTIAADTHAIRLADGPVPADRDFELTWRPAAAKAPAVGLFRERVGTADYLLAFVTPPAVPATEEKRSRAKSSSSSTTPARWAAPRSCRRRRASPTGSAACGRATASTSSASTTRWTCCSPTRWRADRDTIAKAKSFVAALQAQGGTEMLPADARRAHRHARQRCVHLAPGRVPHRRRDRQRA